MCVSLDSGSKKGSLGSGGGEWKEKITRVIYYDQNDNI